ncbi:hypothetical protein BSM4216_3118 [Bacillus smithii]|nr:hypothetical protein BSM4216_3118 [Bacillus smithii]
MGNNSRNVLLFEKERSNVKKWGEFVKGFFFICRILFKGNSPEKWNYVQ